MSSGAMGILAHICLVVLPTASAMIFNPLEVSTQAQMTSANVFYMQWLSIPDRPKRDQTRGRSFGQKLGVVPRCIHIPFYLSVIRFLRTITRRNPISIIYPSLHITKVEFSSRQRDRLQQAPIFTLRVEYPARDLHSSDSLTDDLKRKYFFHSSISHISHDATIQINRELVTNYRFSLPGTPWPA